MQRKSKSAEKQFRAIAKKILDRVATDAKFRKLVLSDPNGALASAGFAQQIESIQWPATGAAVDDCKTTCGYRSCTQTCISTCSISCKNATL